MNILDKAYTTLLDLYMDFYGAWLELGDNITLKFENGCESNVVFTSESELIDYIDKELRIAFDNAYGVDLVALKEGRKNESV